jgi:hypothetical protein
MSFVSSHMEGGTDDTCTASSQGWPGSSLPVLSPYTSYLQVKAEARYLICCDAPALYRLTRISGHIPWSIHRYSRVLFRESMKEVGDHTLKISPRRYEGFPNRLEHHFLML